MEFASSTLFLSSPPFKKASSILAPVGSNERRKKQLILKMWDITLALPSWGRAYIQSTLGFILDVDTISMLSDADILLLRMRMMIRRADCIGPCYYEVV